MATPEPNYTILEHVGNFERRLYDPRIIAKTVVTGAYDSASRQGFKRLADYIFGNNSKVEPANKNSSKSAKISMTAPVIMSPTHETAVNNSEANAKINMSVSVSMSQHNGNWLVAFVMPERYTLESIPKPNNPAVMLEQLPEQHYAVVTFYGLAGELKVAAKTLALQQWMADRELTPIAQPELARYNPPWTLPFKRRNEVMIAYQ